MLSLQLKGAPERLHALAHAAQSIPFLCRGVLPVVFNRQ
jgi:hypothetical protein